MPLLPKRQEVRASGRRYAGAARLPPESRPIRRRPPLPKSREWREETRQWWADVWSSPMAGEFLRSDLNGLYRLAILIDMFWSSPDKGIAAEIRQLEQAYGLGPLARRRLEWQVAQTEEASDRRDRRRSAGALIVNDPRTNSDVFK